jgi:hypothetical protein
MSKCTAGSKHGDIPCCAYLIFHVMRGVSVLAVYAHKSRVQVWQFTHKSRVPRVPVCPTCS